MILARRTKYKVTDSRKLSAQYIFYDMFNAELDKV